MIIENIVESGVKHHNYRTLTLPVILRLLAGVTRLYILNLPMLSVHVKLKQHYLYFEFISRYSILEIKILYKFGENPSKEF